MDAYRKIRIASDGTPKGTRAIDVESGQALPATEISFDHFSHEEPPQVMLTLVGVEVDVTGDLDDRGYHAWTDLWNGCRASVCRTPFGARICAGKRLEELPQYAWDYSTVREAEEALVAAEFRTYMQGGVVVTDRPGEAGTTSGEPEGYLKRWRYTEDGRMEAF